MKCESMRSTYLFLSFVLTASLTSAASRSVAQDIMVADFEGETYGEWKAEGEAFGSAPARGTLPRQQKVAGYQGKGLVNSFTNGDRTTGSLSSPAFTLDRAYLRFLIGGGGHAETALQLLNMALGVSGKVAIDDVRVWLLK